MRKIILLLLIALNSYSQDKLVSYNYKILPNEEILKNEVIGKMFAEDINAAKFVKLNLEFNDSIARFSAQKVMQGDNININSALTHCNCKDDKFIYNNKVYRNNSGGIFEKDTYLIIDNLENNWKFTSETKMIDGYECYKATTEYIVRNSIKTFYHPVIAWYCPQLPYSFGPAGYGGLPGLILELQVWNNVFGVEKIVLNHKIEQEIKVPTKGVVITYEDYNKKIEEAYADYLNEK